MEEDTPPTFGKLENVDIRKAWPKEESHFTPWLAKHIDHICNLVGVDINEIVTEKSVGNYNADIVGKISGENDSYIVIENQYNTSDHDHLGKLLTYISGVNARIGVWIAEDFREEHIAVLNNLNASTRSDSLRLFAIKVQVRQIGGSPYAPDFSIVVAPNDFVRTMSAIGMSDLNKKRLDFFNQLVDKYKSINPSWNRIKPLPQNWLTFSAGKSRIGYSWAFRGTNEKRFSVKLDIYTLTPHFLRNMSRLILRSETSSFAFFGISPSISCFPRS